MMSKEKKRAALKKKLLKLRERLVEAERKETERFSRIPWGAGMRWSNISVSTKKSDELKGKIEELERELSDI